MIIAKRINADNIDFQAQVRELDFELKISIQ
jgi:hypothetical protein